MLEGKRLTEMEIRKWAKNVLEGSKQYEEYPAKTGYFTAILKLVADSPSYYIKLINKKALEKVI